MSNNNQSPVNLDAIAIIKEAYRLTPGMITMITLRATLAVVAVLIFTISMSFFSPLLDVIYVINGAASVLISFVTLIIFAFIMSPVVVACIRRTLGLPFTTSSVIASCNKSRNELFKCIALFSFLLQAAEFLIFLISALIVKSLGDGFYTSPLIIAIYIIPGIIPYIITTIMYIFAIPLVIVRDFDYKAAYKESFKKMRQYWLNIFVCIGLYSIMVILITLPFAIAGKIGASTGTYPLVIFSFLGLVPLIYSLSMYYLICAIIFRNVYRLQ